MIQEYHRSSGLVSINFLYLCQYFIVKSDSLLLQLGTLDTVDFWEEGGKRKVVHESLYTMLNLAQGKENDVKVKEIIFINLFSKVHI